MMSQLLKRGEELARAAQRERTKRIASRLKQLVGGIAIEVEEARVLVSGRGLLPGLSYLAATDAAIASKRLVLQDFLQRVVKAQAWSYRNVDAFSSTLARIIGIPPEAAKLQFERRQQKWIAIDAKVIADQQATADFYEQVGLIKQHLDVRGTFDTGFGTSA